MPLVKIDMIRNVRTPEEIKKLADVITNLNFTRTNKLVFIQALYAELQRRLEKDCGVPRTDLIISCSANTKEDWSFGMGRAQLLTGDL
ncbi:hypothetical protein N431DRAFT_539969 [Stipitochalara longipes BDJ]|nr:hypothetical protein N431DRAFT_539969 [Stipitochalara longipes BDJ]